MFWLSYESFSILSDVFCQKSVISSENNCGVAGGTVFHEAFTRIASRKLYLFILYLFEDKAFFFLCMIICTLCSMLHVPYHFVSYFPFENGVPKCQKYMEKLICEQLAKVSKINCFINFPSSWYKGSVI